MSFVSAGRDRHTDKCQITRLSTHYCNEYWCEMVVSHIDDTGRRLEEEGCSSTEIVKKFRMYESEILKKRIQVCTLILFQNHEDHTCSGGSPWMIDGVHCGFHWEVHEEEREQTDLNDEHFITLSFIRSLTEIGRDRSDHSCELVVVLIELLHEHTATEKSTVTRRNHGIPNYRNQNDIYTYSTRASTMITATGMEVRTRRRTLRAIEEERDGIRMDTGNTCVQTSSYDHWRHGIRWNRIEIEGWILCVNEDVIVNSSCRMTSLLNGTRDLFTLWPSYDNTRGNVVEIVYEWKRD